MRVYIFPLPNESSPHLGRTRKGSYDTTKPMLEMNTPEKNILDKHTVEMNFEKAGGLITAVVQDHQSGEVLQVSYMNAESFALTRKTGRMHYFSRTRNKLWMKGEQSGHFQEVVETLVDCDLDAVVFKIRQIGGAACHTGYRSCFHRRLESAGNLVMMEKEKVFDPAQVYKT